MRTRNVDWLEGKIISCLSRQPRGVNDMTLARWVLRDYVNTIEENKYDAAVQMLLSGGLICRRNTNGVTIYELKKSGYTQN